MADNNENRDRVGRDNIFSKGYVPKTLIEKGSRNIAAGKEKEIKLDPVTEGFVINPWPQTLTNPSNNGGNIGSIGFLPPNLIPVTNTQNLDLSSFAIKDWLGNTITSNGFIPLNTSSKFNESKVMPKTPEELKDSPYSTRDQYIIFGDQATDYFRHGLHIIDNLTPIENPVNGDSKLRLENFKNTPFENTDPVIFGFEIVIDAASSPLLNGSITDFLNEYSNISEVGARIQVYEDFKKQFIKFFRTRGNIQITGDGNTMVRGNKVTSSESSKQIHQSGKKSYMNYYLKKVAGLQNLVESNTSESKKYLVDYRKDVITLDFNEDVSLSVGTLAHLYKLLYWSRPNGKNIIPENLLRFNCDIIISECRNFNRVRKALNGSSVSDLEVIKDNLSRHVYTLSECQLFFNSAPHGNEVDNSGPVVYENYSMSFDYKYSSSSFDKFVPTTDGFGTYASYNGGAIWKVGNPGSRASRGSTQSSIETSLPKFFTVGTNKYNQNGVTTPFITNIHTNFKTVVQSGTAINTNPLSVPSFKKYVPPGFNVTKDNFIDRLKEKTIKAAKVELVKIINTRSVLITRTLNKLGNRLSNSAGFRGIRDPRNVYQDDYQSELGRAISNIKNSIFYDVRNEVAGFAGNALGNILNSATVKFNNR